MKKTKITIVSFEDTSVAFIGKSDKELKFARFLFRLFESTFLVKIFSNLTLLFLKMRLPIKKIILRTIYKQFCAAESLEESKKKVENLFYYNVCSILDYSVEGSGKESDFIRAKNEIVRVILFAKKRNEVPFTCLKLSGISKLELLIKYNSNFDVNSTEMEVKNTIERFHSICYTSQLNNVPIFIDAEESWIQSSIDSLVEQAMRKFNRSKAVVLTTIQMYRWDRLDYLKALINTAREEKFYVGIKLVRGAYFEKENERALIHEYRSPIHSNKDNVDIDFNRAITICLENIDIVTLCIGSHNEESAYFAIKEMDRLGLQSSDKNVYFSQLFGMSDHITFNLAANGFNVAKYLPYGPVESVVPYLIRRAEENSAISGQMGRELKLITTEIERRRKKDNSFSPRRK